MHGEIDLGLWCRRIILVVWLLIAVGFGVLVVAKFWEGWSLGASAHREASRTLDRCAKGDVDTKHFRRSCEEATQDCAKDPLIYAIEHTWDKLWPCRTALCVDAMARLTRSIWTILAVSVLFSVGVVYLMGCSGTPRNQIMWTNPPLSYPKHCHPDPKPSSCILDVSKMQ